MNDTIFVARDADALHAWWVQKRDAAIVDLMASRQAHLANWFAIADAATTPEERSSGALIVRMATVAADCAGAHAAAADGYFRLASSMQVGDGSALAARRWYTRSLVHAEQAGGDFEIARCAYCLGAIEEAEDRPDNAVTLFMRAREHAERAGNLGGKAAALYRLALLAMAKLQFDVALELALESYMVSRDAKQFLPAAQTLTELFKFLAQNGFDFLAEKPAVDLLSHAIVLVSEQPDNARVIAAQTLRAIAPLNVETRTAILRGVEERFGAEVVGLLGCELDSIVTFLRNSG